MANWSNEAEAREQIKALVAEYYHDFKEKKADFKPGDRVTYASRVFDEKEMCALTDATLDFWLTTGRFADEFEKEFAKWIGVKFANLAAGIFPPESHTLLNATVFCIHSAICQRGFQPKVDFNLLQSSFKKFASCGAFASARFSHAVPSPHAWQNRSTRVPVVTQSQSSGPTL